ncbi:MAG: hypothetical protein IPI24_03255 [Ignavibacteria bacterium]|nr:hypothetical protein [Ignavibacteria bacterium]
MTVELDSRFVKAIDHGFALRQGGKVFIHHGYASEPSDSIEHPETNDYWSVSADGKLSASWGWGPRTATVQWSKGDEGTVELPTNGQATCAVLSDSVIAVWNSNLFISRPRPNLAPLHNTGNRPLPSRRGRDVSIIPPH